MVALQSYVNGRMALLPTGVQATVLKEVTTEARMHALFAAFETGKYDKFGDMETDG